MKNPSCGAFSEMSESLKFDILGKEICQLRRDVSKILKLLEKQSENELAEKRSKRWY